MKYEIRKKLRISSRHWSVGTADYEVVVQYCSDIAGGEIRCGKQQNPPPPPVCARIGQSTAPAAAVSYEDIMRTKYDAFDIAKRDREGEEYRVTTKSGVHDPCSPYTIYSRTLGHHTHQLFTIFHNNSVMILIAGSCPIMT